VPTIERPDKYKLRGAPCSLRDGVRALLSHQLHRMRRTWYFYQRESGLPDYSLRGDFNSPLPDISEGQRFATMAFDYKSTDNIPGIDLRADAQKRLLLKMADVYPEFDWSEQRIPNRRFHFAT
jgi:hypothetical protein